MSDGNFTRKIGTNRTKARIWLEGACLSAFGWTKGTRFNVIFEDGKITYQKDPGGSRRVAGGDDRPVIDTNTDKIRQSLGGRETAKIKATASRIVITVLAVAAMASVFIPRYAPNALKVLVACEFSGTVRDAFAARGHDAVSCDLLESDRPGDHIVGDVREVLGRGWDLTIGFPPCPLLTNASVWLLKDPDFDRYPGVGYHQRIKPGTLFGEERREAAKRSVEFALEIYDSCDRAAIENPVGGLSREFRKPDQIIQPFQFGHPESKSTCLWVKGLDPLVPTDLLDIERDGKEVSPGKFRWLNQTASGQSNIAPSEDRWKIRSLTYAGIAEAMANQWG